MLAAIIGKSSPSAPGMTGLRMSLLQLILATPIGDNHLPDLHADLWATAYHQPEILPP